MSRGQDASTGTRETARYSAGEPFLQFLTFVVAEEIYGIPIATVAEIIGIQKITTVPDRRPYVKGVINLRGTVIPVIDVRVRLAMDPVQLDDRTCIVVVQHEDSLVGLLVDRIAEVIDVLTGEIETATRRRVDFVGEAMVTGFVRRAETIQILIDLPRLIEDVSSGEDAGGGTGD